MMTPIAASGHGAFYDDPTFWVAVAFVILIVLAGKKIVGAITAMLDERAAGIKTQIDEATRLREEAQELLASYERKQHEAVQEAEGIVTRAEEEAKRLGEMAEEDLASSLKRREQQAMERIAQAETAALDEVRGAAVDIALEATRKVLSEKVAEDKVEALVDDAIKGLPGKLH